VDGVAMSRGLAVWFGLGGVSADDGLSAHDWQLRLHWVMFGVALLSVPAYLFDTAHFHPAWRTVADALDALIFVAFLGELVWMLRVTKHRIRYLARNWLNLIILAAAFASLLGAATEWIALVRILRVALVGLVSVRVLAEFRSMFKVHGAPALVGVACIVLVVAGGLLYWLEPTAHTYWDGLWLAFVTATTVGYGDVVPTTPAARIVAAFVVLTGLALIAVFTASIVAFFLGEDEKRLRVELHGDIRNLRANLAQLIDQEDILLRRDLLREVGALKQDIAALRTELASSDRARPSSDARAATKSPRETVC
jgi:voltage-gated potassium channel